jgi:tetratricopeptide (TPR) repeat protein
MEQEDGRAGIVAEAIGLIEAQQHVEAVALLRPFVEENSQDPGAWAALARAHSELEQWPEAKEAAKQSVALDPNEAEYLVQLGAIKRELEDFLGAHEALRQALTLEPYSEQANSEMRKLRELRRRRTEAARTGVPYDPNVDGAVDKTPMRSFVWIAVGVFAALWLIIWLVMWLQGSN